MLAARYNDDDDNDDIHINFKIKEKLTFSDDYFLTRLYQRREVN